MVMIVPLVLLSLCAWSAAQEAVTVALDGTGQYTEINSAISYAQINNIATVTVKAGTYTEAISIQATATVTIVGETAATGSSYSDNLVTITNDGGDVPPVTFVTSTSKGVAWKNLNFVNSNANSAAGIISLRGSRNAFYSCQFTAAGQVGFTGSQATGIIANSYIQAADKAIYSYGSLYIYQTTITATNSNALLVYNKGATDSTGKQYNSTVVFDTCQVIQKPGSTNTNVFLAAANGAGSVVVYRDTSLASFIASTGVHVDATTQDFRNTYIESDTTGPGSYSNKPAARSPYVSLVTDVTGLAPYDISVFFSNVYPTVVATDVDWVDAPILASIQRSTSGSTTTSTSSSTTIFQESSTLSTIATTSTFSTPSTSSAISTFIASSYSTVNSSTTTSADTQSTTASLGTSTGVAATSGTSSTSEATISSSAVITTSVAACLPSSMPSTALIVGPANSSCATYNSVTAAIAALPADTTTQYIYILAGTYNEKVSLVRTGTTIIRGETDNALSSSSNKVTIRNASGVLSSAGNSAGTATFSANKYEAKLVSFYNINFENNFPSQTNYIALAAYSKGTKVAFYSCNVKSSQGSIYLDYGNVFFSGGRIEGTTDFVWGIGAGYFYNSVIVSTDTIIGQSIAAQRYQNAYGGSQLVFDGCAVVPSGQAVSQQTVYLGRDYSTNAQVAFINSYLDAHIYAAGWKISNAATFTGTFVEANNTGPGASASGRASVVQILSDTSAYTVKNILSDDSWLDSAAIAPHQVWPSSVYAVATTTPSNVTTTTVATQTGSAVVTNTTSSMLNTFTVAPSPASGEYSTVSSAIAALPADGKEYTIFIKAGTYEEQVSITRRGKVTLRGETPFENDFTQNTVLINFSRGVSTSLGQNEDTPVMDWKNTNGDGLALYNINFTNTYPQQASTAALAGDFFGTNMAAYGCAFSGFQDTLLVNQGVQVFSNSYIEGSVDFIWGYSKAYFRQCYVASNTPNTYIAAQNRPNADWAGGFVFDKSVITYTSSFGSNFGTTFLGRPWSQYAVIVYMNSFLDKHISPAGWSVWQPSNPQTSNVLFGEYNNVGGGNWTDARASFATDLTDAQAAQYSLENFIGNTGWIDAKAYAYTPSYNLTALASASDTTVPTSPVLTHPTSGSEPPAGAVLVAADGSIPGAFTNLTAALASLPSDTSSQVIFMYPGTYNEQVPSINRPGPIMIIGYTSDAPGKSYKNNQVTITQARGLSVSPAPVGHSDAETATIATASSQISWYNIDLVNRDNLDGAIASYVTLAASIYGDKIGFYGCSFVGWQDTLLTGATAGTQYYESCYIDGAIDFIWGYSKAYFKGCTIAAKRAKSAMTAHSRSSLSSIGGYIFDQCLFTEAPTATVDLKGMVYLGRPYSQYALVVVKNSYLSDVIQPAGWKTWSASDPRTDHVTFAEYNNTGPGNWENNIAARQAFQNCTLLTSDEYPLSKVMPSTDWIDMTYWDQIQIPEPDVVPVTPTTPTVYDGTKPPSGAFIVSKTPIEGQTTYDTIQAALNALPTSSKIASTIFIYPGTYNEQLTLNKSGTTILLGYSSASGDYSQNQVTISFNKGIDTQADASNSDSATVYATGNYLQAVNINFANTFGTDNNYASLGFAVKSSRYASLYGCQVYGNQDSLLINGFFFASNSYIEGNIDMIWGAGAGYFLNSTIAPNRDGIALTASKRATNTTAAGFVFDQCTITPAKGAKYTSISLGRPWNAFARVAYIDSYLDSCIKTTGWDQWTKTDPRTDGAVFGEFANDGPGSELSSRAPFATKLTSETAAQFELANFFSVVSWINMTLVSATPFQAGAIVMPTTTVTSTSTSITSTESSSIPVTTTTVFTTQVSTLTGTLLVSVQKPDTVMTLKSTLTINAATAITPPPVAKTTVVKSTTTEVATIQEPDFTVTQKLATTVNVGTTISHDPVVATSTLVATSTRTEVITQQAKPRTITSTITTTRWTTSTPKVVTTTQVIGATQFFTKTITPKPVIIKKTETQTIGDGGATTITAKALVTTATVYTTITRVAEKTTTIKCIPTNGLTERSFAEFEANDMDIAAGYLEARAVGDWTVTVTILSTFSTNIKTSTISLPGSTATTELITTKTEGKPVTLKPATIFETSVAVRTLTSVTTLAGTPSTTTILKVVSAGKTTTLKPSTSTVVVEATQTVVVKSTTKLDAITQNVVKTQTQVATSVLPQQTEIVTRQENSSKTQTVVLPVQTSTVWTTVRSTAKPSATITNRSTITKTKTLQVGVTVTSWATQTSKNAKACTAA
ncbi:putative pentatricopeptide repeat-containing protein [Colletotrichum spaethianum]|uniref:pectinesterase n=1 Tax=Colletotrichum spaethianum TaxID=700344 RepID=A0AA37P7V5_9PEZI|nr:putative pentatricopeptide repeat-containing protein [Colletotrichum spaethianum]GKT45889.1 putative pentatricopeptide repeat-containing protein [Colletotrichum spaethianum]